ncbi:HAD family hydrolase [Bacillus manliponensis]|uniref:HAD family hydrolase n=1 Tax=Bacillus manliponensis TaxID=574376 RepID=A0A073JTA9_9BACI|nr:HAD-IB family phosphatase [Bacillus manliponensis]KEK18314.1 HAD family hydrolase [Bacillus manliponensis]
MVKYIIFDFDGTLVDSKDVFLASYNQIATKHNYKVIEKEELEGLRKISIRERCKLLKIPMYKIPFFVKELGSLYKQSIGEIILVDGIRPMLQDLKNKGYKIAIISSNREENIRQFLKNHDIHDVHDVFCSSNIFGKDKVMKQFLKEKKLGNEEVLYVGDEERDIAACKKVGIAVAWVGWGYDVLETIQESSPDYVVYKPEELTQVVASIK